MPSLKWLKVDEIKIPEGRLKSYFDNLEDFEASVKAEGVIQPIYVFEDDRGNYWLADGQNRLEVAKKQDRPIIQCYILHGSEQDALIYSAKLNVHRGHVNVGGLCEFVKRLKDKGMKVEDIANNLRLSKGYISQLLTIAEFPEIIEKLKKGLISIKEAYKSAKSLTVKQVSEETRHEKPCETRPLTDEDLGLTSNLKEAMEAGKRFIPIKPEKSEEKEVADYRRFKCVCCDVGFKLGEKPRWIPVHDYCETDALNILEKARAERKARSESSQPRGVC